jgi:hypothetical protein
MQVMNRKLRMLFPALIFFFTVRAQENGFFHYSSIGVQYFAGTTIGNTYSQISDSRPFMGEIFYQQQTNPNPSWNHTKRLPQWGFGFAATHSGSQYIGGLLTLYPYMKVPLITAGIFQSDLRMAFGLGWVQKPYDEISNTENLLLSQKINTHANISWQNEVRLSAHHFLNAAISYYHWSNAKTSLPNLGMNIPSVGIGYRYAFNGETRKPVQSHDSVNKKLFYKLFLTAGVKQMQVPDSSRYLVTLLTGEASKQISYSSTVSVGMFITHDASVRTDTLVKNLGGVPTSQVAVYGSYEYNFGRLIIPVQLGVFIYNSNSKILESVGMRYKLSRNWMVQLLLKAHGHKADLMHFGFGYLIR